MQDVLIVAIVFAAIVTVLKLLVDANTRSKLIQKGLVDEKAKYLFSKSDHPVRSNLKWGLVLVGIGAAFLIRQLFDYYFDDTTILGFMFLFAGIGFLVYYTVSPKNGNGAASGQ